MFCFLILVYLTDFDAQSKNNPIFNRILTFDCQSEDLANHNYGRKITLPILEQCDLFKDAFETDPNIQSLFQLLMLRTLNYSSFKLGFFYLKFPYAHRSLYKVLILVISSLDSFSYCSLIIFHSFGNEFACFYHILINRFNQFKFALYIFSMIL